MEPAEPVVKGIRLPGREDRLRFPEQTDIVMGLVGRGNLDEVETTFFKTGNRFDLHPGAEVIGGLAVLVGRK